MNLWLELYIELLIHLLHERQESTNTGVSLGIVAVFKPVFMHDPVSLLAMGSSSSVENKGFPHTDLLQAVPNALVPSCCFPKSCISCPIRPWPRWILPILVTEKIPLVLWSWSNPTSLYRCIMKIKVKQQQRSNLSELVMHLFNSTVFFIMII